MGVRNYTKQVRGTFQVCFQNVCVCIGQRWRVARRDESWVSEGEERFRITEEKGILEIVSHNISNLKTPNTKFLINKYQFLLKLQQ